MCLGKCFLENFNFEKSRHRLTFPSLWRVFKRYRLNPGLSDWLTDMDPSVEGFCHLSTYFDILLIQKFLAHHFILCPKKQVKMYVIHAWLHKILQNTIFWSGSSVGTSLSHFLTGYLSANFGWKYSFYFFGLLAIFFTPFWMFFCFNKPQLHPGICKVRRESKCEQKKE